MLYIFISGAKPCMHFLPDLERIKKMRREEESFLCPTLKYLLVDAREDHLLNTQQHNLVSQNLTFNWCYISPRLEGLSPSLAGCDHQSLNQIYSAVCHNLWPVIIQCGIKLQECETPPVEFWKWTNCQSEIQLYFKQMQDRPDLITPYKICLFLSATFEHSIGNVLQLKQKTIPFLLRDLLSTNELQDIFGKDQMLLAHILLGTPLAFNIRNVCWHGFPAPHEIHMDVVAALIILITSFGEILCKSQITTFPCRLKMNKSAWSPILPSLLSTKFPLLTESMKDVMEFIEFCSVIPSSQRVYWSSSLNFLHDEQYGDCMLLLLPALEHTLRCIFCSVNDCPGRVRVAEQHFLYTTMDEILSKSFTISEGITKMNNVPLVLGDKVMEMLMDLFDSFAGPRIRDKLSHGECDLNDIPATVANHVFCVSLLVLLKLQDSSKLEIKSILNHAEENYSAKFHSVYLLKTQARAVNEKLNSWHAHFKQITNLPEEILALQSTLMKHSHKIFNSIDDNILKTIDLCLNMPTVSLYRTKSDLSIINILRKITGALENICDNLLHTAAKHQLSQNTLRSRQRMAHFRLLKFVPSLQAFLRCILTIVLFQLLILPERMVQCHFLKSLQQYGEKVASLTSQTKNRWVESQEKTEEFCSLCVKVLSSPDSGPNFNEPAGSNKNI